MGQNVIVVGSGPVGAALARRLVERGCEVTLVERGDPVALPDLPGARPGEHLRNRPCHQRDPEAFLVAALSHSHFFDLSAPPDGLPGASETIAFGGQGLIWTNNCPRTQAGIDRWDALDDGAWEARYAEAEALLGVTTETSRGSERQRRIAERLSAHPAAGAPGRLVRDLPLAGRPDGAGGVYFHATADILGDLAQSRASRLRIRRARAVALERARGRVRGLRVVAETSGDAGRAGAEREERIAADAVVVAAGAFASPRLLFASGIRPAALGRWRRGCEPSWNPWGFSHPMGTTRMGDDPATSVVDRRGRVHGMENLYVAGPGVVPVAIAVNPTLTAVTLALVTADAIAAGG